jgi:hypothetical protein
VDGTPDHEPVDTRRFPSSWRLTFRYDEDGTVELAGREEVPMVAPGSPGSSPVSEGGLRSVVIGLRRRRQVPTASRRACWRIDPASCSSSTERL